MTVCQDKAGTEESVRFTKEWISKMQPTSPWISRRFPRALQSFTPRSTSFDLPGRATSGRAFGAHVGSVGLPSNYETHSLRPHWTSVHMRAWQSRRWLCRLSDSYDNGEFALTIVDGDRTQTDPAKGRNFLKWIGAVFILSLVGLACGFLLGSMTANAFCPHRWLIVPLDRLIRALTHSLSLPHNLYSAFPTGSERRSTLQTLLETADLVGATQVAKIRKSPSLL